MTGREQSETMAGMSLIYTLPSIVERIDLAKLFPAEQPLEVELGSGDGSFLAEYARLHRGITSSGWNGCSAASGNWTAKGGAPG